MDLTDLFSDDLPEEARALIEAAERAIEPVRKKADRDAERVRSKAERDIQALQEKADAAVREMQERLVAQLKPLQQQYAREGLLDEALAIRQRIRQAHAGAFGVQPVPEVLACRPQDVGRSFLFDATGTTTGPLWGTDVYTADSSPATAAVHAGVLGPGERGVIRVTVVDTRDRRAFEGTLRNGVHSEEWDEWEFGFTVSRA